MTKEATEWICDQCGEEAFFWGYLNGRYQTLCWDCKGKEDGFGPYTDSDDDSIFIP